MTQVEPAGEPARRVTPLRATMLLLQLRARSTANAVRGYIPFLKPADGRRGRSIMHVIALVATAWIATITFELLIGASAQVDASDSAVVGVVLLLATGLVLHGLSGRGSGDLAKPDLEFESLLVYPASLTTLHLADWVWRSAFTGYAWALFFPALGVIGAHGGHGWWSLLLAAALVPPLSAIALLGRAIVVRGIRQTLSAFWIRGLQSVATIITGAFVMLCGAGAIGDPRISAALAPPGADAATIGPSLQAAGTPLWRIVDVLDGAVQWTPWGAGALVAYLPPRQVAIPLLTFVAGVVLTLAVGWSVFAALLRRGPVVVRGGRQRHRAGGRLRAWPRGPLSWELMLSTRMPDRWVFGGLVPTAILIAIILMDLRGIGVRYQLMVALTIGWAPVLLGTHQAHRHQKTIWLQYTLPHPVVGVFRRTAQFWFCVAALYTMVGVVFHSTGEQPDLTVLLPGVVCLLLSLYFLAHIGVAYDALATDMTFENSGTIPLAHGLLLTIVTWFCYTALAITDLRIQVGIMVLLGALTLGLWQRLVRYEPYLLDPTVGPPNDLTLADGAIIALLHVVGLVLAQLLIERVWGAWWPLYALSSGVAAIAAIVPGGIYLWRRKIPDFRHVIGLSQKLSSRVLHAGLRAGLASSAVMIAYVGLSLHWPWFGELTTVSRATLYVGSTTYVAALIPLLVIVTPLGLELIFRGLIFRSLSSSFPLPLAVGASALMFAVLHPTSMFVPLFALGLVAALAFARTDSLVAPITAHAVHSATLLAIVAVMPMPHELAAETEQCDGGDMDACIRLADRHRIGDRVPRDRQRTVELYQQACERGSPEGCAGWGAIVGHASWGPRDQKRAIEIWADGCERGYASSCASLGDQWYLQGDFQRAVESYDLACDLEDSELCFTLGVAFSEGSWTDADETRANEFFQRACDLGEERACERVDASSSTHAR